MCELTQGTWQPTNKKIQPEVEATSAKPQAANNA